MNEMTVWIRAGITVTLSEKNAARLKDDPVKFEKSGVLDKAIGSAIKKGAFKFDGESYIPNHCFSDDEVNEVYEKQYPEGIDVSVSG